MRQPSRRALVLRHVPFEDLGTLEPVLRQRNFQIATVDVPRASLPIAQAGEADLLIALGGPICVYGESDFPFVEAEIALLGERLSRQKPTLGICLGAQLMAAALGARVYPGGNGAEIGWSPLKAATDVLPEWFRPIVAPGQSVLHWHGDTFDLPANAVHLARSEKYANQAFAIGSHALAMQFHAEVTPAGLESWYVGHVVELAKHGISIPALRARTRAEAPALAPAAGKLWNGWLDAAF